MDNKKAWIIHAPDHGNDFWMYLYDITDANGYCKEHSLTEISVLLNLPVSDIDKELKQAVESFKKELDLLGINILDLSRF